MGLFAQLLRFGRARWPVDEGRWIVLDVEASGLDAQREHLLAIAAIAIEVDWQRGRLSLLPGDSFEVVLRQQLPMNKDNILLHGIGVDSQRQGQLPSLALQAFAQFVGNSPLLAFHAVFDQTLIERHMRLHGQALLNNPWLDIEHLCAVTHEQVRARSLDEWLSHFSISCAQRHQAAADTLAEGQLLLRIWPRVAPQCRNWDDVVRLAAHRPWIARAL